MAFGELLRYVGDSGRFQILNAIVSILLVLITSPPDYMENFTAAIPSHRCYVQLLDNLTSEASIPANLTTEALLRVSIPMDPSQKPEKCHRFRQTQWQLLHLNVSDINNTQLETEPCLEGWIYDQSVFSSTIMTEWNLVCKFQSFKTFAQAIYMAGYVVGTPLFSMLSDRFGRKPLLLFCCLMCGISGTCCAFAPVFSIYCVLRFLCSACLGSLQINCIVLVLEETSSKWHSTILTAYGISLSLGQALLGVIAYAIRDWHMLQLALSVPFLILSLFLCMVSESVRWLIVTGKTEQALKELKKIAYINGKKDVAQSLTAEILTLKMKEELNIKKKHFKMKEVIFHPTLCRTLLFGSFLGFSSLFSTYGLMLDIKNLGKDIFLSQFLLGMIDMPARFLTLFVLRHVGRRPSIAFSFLVSGIGIIVNIFVSKDMSTLRLIIFILIKASLASFLVIYMAFCNEITPTTHRLSLQSIFGIASKLAGTCSALVLATESYFVHLPMILYGIFPIAAAGCVYLLPETFKLPLPDTIEDLEKRDRFRNKGTRKKHKNVLYETTEC
ncbi:solute carrier family 22 member 22-like [Ochotona princeps]|uniref:solute carrier family 22 member 22-like n=1 Tax=Ochotona princeps TaxID=9978 RepID=UPI0027150579|nr:solute carrier family 22 member 22-like [Ochotona princeps]